MVLSTSQLSTYFDRIALPERTRKLLFQGPKGKDALKAITTLQQYHMSSVPYENLDLHYSSHRTLPLDTESVYNRVVLQKRGGTCIQVNLFFAQVLRSIGFSAYCTGGRLNAAASVAAPTNVNKTNVSFGAWSHAHTLVTIGGQKYFVETNFNQNGSPSPVALVHDEVVRDVGPRQRRLVHSAIPIGDNSQPAQKWWRMQIRQTEKEPWMDVYCFSEVEWMPIDFEIMSAGMAALGGGWFTKLIVCFRLLLEDQIPVGYYLILGDELRSSYKGKTQVLQKFYSEHDRVAALEEEFGIILNDDELAAIEGTCTELVQESFDYYG